MVEKNYEAKPEDSKEENIKENENNENQEEMTGSEPAQNQAEEKAQNEEIEKLKRDIDEINQRYLRIAADFDNFRKRTKSEKEELIKYANVGLVSEILPVLDNFERALDIKEPSEEVQQFLTGMEMIYKQLVNILSQAGLKPIETLGEKFDPAKHEAVMQVTDTEAETDTIVEELRKGYIFKDKVIRPSMVKVAK